MLDPPTTPVNVAIIRAMRIRLLTPLLTAVLLAACGQKGPLYQPDEGISVAPATAPAADAPPASGPDGAPAPGTGTQAAPVTPASPDRTDEPRKRIHTP